MTIIYEILCSVTSLVVYRCVICILKQPQYLVDCDRYKKTVKSVLLMSFSKFFPMKPSSQQLVFRYIRTLKISQLCKLAVFKLIGHEHKILGKMQASRNRFNSKHRITKRN